jgi:hypothetical protein
MSGLEGTRGRAEGGRGRFFSRDNCGIVRSGREGGGESGTLVVSGAGGLAGVLLILLGLRIFRSVWPYAFPAPVIAWRATVLFESIIRVVFVVFVAVFAVFAVYAAFVVFVVFVVDAAFVAFDVSVVFVVFIDFVFVFLPATPLVSTKLFV